MSTRHHSALHLAACAVVAAALTAQAPPTASAAEGPSPATAPAALTHGQSSLEAQTLELINQHRRTAGCQPLRPLPALQSAASRHSDFMARAHALVHSTTPPPSGHDGHRRPPRAWAENIATGHPTAATVVTAWMNSPGHRRNILNCAYTHTGLGLTAYQGRTWWTHLLATAP
ncbi:CAP domain-containing protein [Streptomyces sp. DH24]|uniref:CAP domain-containing protein n=1 Tax=Streptomyces sp. DH24 TaxID=3040123 RepID=UPI0024412A27|nr:CAP domain-containing protein [Streptomyces sp. DH24]MDG9720667.1 CAP domain-containing protein [Streptomyces sp. DH24]